MLKTKKAVSSRFRVSKSGKVKKCSPGKRHLATGKSKARKRRLKRASELSHTQSQAIRRLLPYG